MRNPVKDIQYFVKSIRTLEFDLRHFNVEDGRMFLKTSIRILESNFRYRIYELVEENRTNTIGCYFVSYKVCSHAVSRYLFSKFILYELKSQL